jgi:hypothetical protein
MQTKLTEKDAGGMTVNERLYLSGLFDEFDIAVATRDEEKLREILKQIFLSEENINAIVENELGK